MIFTHDEWLAFIADRYDDDDARIDVRASSADPWLVVRDRVAAIAFWSYAEVLSMLVHLHHAALALVRACERMGTMVTRIPSVEKAIEIVHAVWVDEDDEPCAPPPCPVCGGR